MIRWAIIIFSCVIGFMLDEVGVVYAGAFVFALAEIRTREWGTGGKPSE